ncbi:hypothetical protein RclHR1_05920007 [Rhizophagus clarus]|uniref:Galactose oxidase n=1 Tax=Rhizophagus clarus TaxID=94130 RepID=A0A2Z6SGW0_9GLOM|nr:hypothetical protein RclHR1_05920007 [Rhizophagus clarus]GET01641.1 hypothetical protein GLOIN_2v1779981 [Rhizophagus clarus]
MTRKNLMYIALWLLIQLLAEINCQMTPYKPKLREGHTATLIDNKLYILGGDFGDNAGKDFFYLDVSVPFNTQNLLWNDLSNINIIPSHYDCTSVKGGANNNTLFFYGGDKHVTDFVYTFNSQSNSWSIPKIAGDVPINKFEMTGIIDHKGIMYLWSGAKIADRTDVDDMLILDTINLVWGKGNLVGVPIAREFYGAALLPDNSIIYIGGYNAKELPLNQVYLYDTINDNWSAKTTSGVVPPDRDGLSAVLGLDGQRVIIFGGSTNYGGNTVKDLIYELNLINYEWRIPKTFGKIPKSRMYHKANVIGKYMVISFGGGYDQSTESDILLLDISNVDEYIWTNEFYPPTSSIVPSPSAIPSLTSKVSVSSPSATSPPSSNSSSIVSSQSSQLTSSSPTAMIGAVIGSLFGGILLSFVGFYLYRWNRNKYGDKNPYNNDNNNQYQYDHGHEIVQPPNDEYTINHQHRSTPASVINNSGQKSTPTANDGKLTLQGLQQEIQDLRQIILHNSKQSKK